MLEGLADVEALSSRAERQQVERGEVARRVVEEHVLRARVRSPDRTRLRARVPVVDGGVELDAGIGRGPGGMADLLPQVARLERLHRSCRVVREVSVQSLVASTAFRNSSVTRTELFEFWPETREIGFAVPVGVVGRELDVRVALLGELDDAQDVVVRHLRRGVPL